MDVPSFLKQLDLEAFETAFNVCGYDSVDTLRELTPEVFITLVKDTGMKSGHAVKLRCALALPPAAAKPAAEPKAAAEGAGSLLAALHLDPDLRRSGPLLRSARGATALPTATANAAGGPGHKRRRCPPSSVCRWRLAAHSQSLSGRGCPTPFYHRL